jgi:hypothetical protein
MGTDGHRWAQMGDRWGQPFAVMSESEAMALGVIDCGAAILAACVGSCRLEARTTTNGPGAIFNHAPVAFRPFDKLTACRLAALVL